MEVDPATMGETWAPTVGIVSVMSLISLATSIGFQIRTADIEGAFLIPDLKPGSPKRHIYVDRIMSQRYCERYPEYREFRDSDQRLTLEELSRERRIHSIIRRSMCVSKK